MRHEFVENVPDRLEEGVLYVSLPYATAVHNCACGCGHEVVTPFSPTDWSLTFDGETISLDHSIGNWSFRCRSHYLIKKGHVVWVGPMSSIEIAEGRAGDRSRKEAQYDAVETKAIVQPPRSRWMRFLNWLTGTR